jgi:hypothetical protein
MRLTRWSLMKPSIPTQRLMRIWPFTAVNLSGTRKAVLKVAVVCRWNTGVTENSRSASVHHSMSVAQAWRGLCTLTALNTPSTSRTNAFYISISCWAIQLRLLKTTVVSIQTSAVLRVTTSVKIDPTENLIEALILFWQPYPDKAYYHENSLYPTTAFNIGNIWADPNLQ